MTNEEKILEALETQIFADFYNEDMDAYILGEDAPSKEEILKKISRIFRKVVEEK